MASARMPWAPGLRAMATLLFAALALVWPDITPSALALLFGQLALVHSMTLLATAHQAASSKQFLAYTTAGITGAGIGLLSIAWPGITATALARLAGAWALLAAAAQLLDWLNRRSREPRYTNLLALAAAAWLAAGITLLPAAGTVSPTALARITAIAALIAATLLLVAEHTATRTDTSTPLRSRHLSPRQDATLTSPGGSRRAPSPRVGDGVPVRRSRTAEG